MTSAGHKFNSVTLLVSVVATLRAAGLDVWVGGGWGEELRQMLEPRTHKDIDLLLRADNFDEWEAFLRGDRTSLQWR